MWVKYFFQKCQVVYFQKHLSPTTTLIADFKDNKFKDDNQIKTLEPISKEYCKLHPKEDLREVLMQGLHFYLEDILKEKV